jgi:hypothetical protein
MCEKKESSLVQKQSITLFVINQLLSGINVEVAINDKICTGYVNRLDLALNSDHVFAHVSIEDPSDEKEMIDLRIAIYTDGKVIILPNQTQND